MPRSLKEWQDEIAANLLEDLERLTGVSIGEMMADEIKEPGEYEVYPVYEEPTEDEPLDIDTDYEGDTDDYFDELFDDLDVDVDQEDGYGDDNNA
jgi:hypothetical protein